MLALLQLPAGFMDGSAPFYATAATAKYDNGTADKVSLDEYVGSGARCLDGTPAAYYLRKGVGDGANKWYIHHQGGGWCESLDDCLSRAGGPLGSSKSYGPTRDLGGGYFSPLPSENPMMYNWNFVFMPYCDGGSFSGNNMTVTDHKNTSLYFRGKHVREAVADSLLKTKGLEQATDVVVSGCSAGGLATFLHTDQWCDAVADSSSSLDKCVGLPDSGFFLDYQSPLVNATALPSMVEERNRRALVTKPGNYHEGLEWCFKTFNATAGVNKDCIASKASGDSPAYLCMFAEHTSVFTHTPIFALQSEYDSWQTGHVLHPGDDTQTLGNNLTARIQANLFGPHPQSGAFLDSCHHHCGMWNQIRIDGVLVSEAFSKWYATLATPKSKRVWNQGKAYPCDDCCKP